MVQRRRPPLCFPYNLAARGDVAVVGEGWERKLHAAAFHLTSVREHLADGIDAARRALKIPVLALVFPTFRDDPPHLRWWTFVAGDDTGAARRYLSVALAEQLPLRSIVQPRRSHQIDRLRERSWIVESSRHVGEAAVFVWGDKAYWEDVDNQSRVGDLVRAIQTVLEVVERIAFLVPWGEPPHPAANRTSSSSATGIGALLGLVRAGTRSDLVYLGRPIGKELIVEQQVGALHANFGFSLPIGEGFGGRALLRGRTLGTVDYQNARYRYSGVRDVCDAEHIRSGMAIPVFRNNRIWRVLYATRRNVNPYSVVEQAVIRQLVLSLTRTEAPEGTSPSRKMVVGLPGHTSHWGELTDILLQGHLRTLEDWVERALGVPVLVTDSTNNPVLATDLHRYDWLQGDEKAEKTTVSVSAPVLGRDAPMLVHFMGPEEEHSPELLRQVSLAAALLYERDFRTANTITAERQGWVSDLLGGDRSNRMASAGVHLGIPVSDGICWVIAMTDSLWDGGRLTARGASIQEFLETTFLMLSIPLGDILICFPTVTMPDPWHVREALLTQCGARQVRVVRIGKFDNLQMLADGISSALETLRSLSGSPDSPYVTDIESLDLRFLMANQAVHSALTAFTNTLFHPLSSWDASHNSDLLKTLCYSRICQSRERAAEMLYVHINTVRFRLHKAFNILGYYPNNKHEAIAIDIAAYTWLYDNNELHRLIPSWQTTS